MNKNQSEIVYLINKKKLLGKEHSKIQNMKILKGGMTNQNYLCTTETGKKYVIRIPGINTSNIIDRKNEWENHRKIERLKLNVEHIVYLKNSWIKSSVYIENKFDTITSKTKQINAVCSALKVLHNSGIHFNNNFWVVDMIRTYEDVAKRNKIALKSNYYALREALKKNHDNYLYSKMNWAPCHNDIVKENILIDESNKIYLIDWEYSGMNDPLWDITSFILENKLTVYEENYMLKQYFKDRIMRNETKKMVLLFKIYQDILWHIWAKIKIFYGDKYDRYSKKRLDRAIVNYRILDHL